MMFFWLWIPTFVGMTVAKGICLPGVVGYIISPETPTRGKQRG